jgi:peptide/nickel transport system permease protein
MLSFGREWVREAWWFSFFPGFAIFVTVLCLNLVGDGWRDALDPRL